MRHGRALALLAGAFLLSIAAAQADDPTKHSNWPRFRGPLGTGHSPEIDLPVEWSPSTIAWQLPLGADGQSSPVVWGDRLFLTAAPEKGYKRAVLCIDRNSGKIAWQKEYSTGNPGKTHNMNQHASATCCTDGKLVISSFGKGGLFCHDVDGKEIWRRSDLGEFLSIWGTASSPILHGDLVVLACDQDTVEEKEQPADAPSKAFIIAMNKSTGETIWQTPRMASRGFGTPVVVKGREGKDELVLNGPGGVVAYDPATGKENWRADRDSLFGEPAVVYDDEMLFAVGGRPGPLYAIRKGGVGDITKTHLAWTEMRKSRDLSSPIIANGLLFTADMQGIGICYDPKTGEQIWKSRFQGEITPSPVAADGKLYFLTRRGETIVLEPAREYKEIARNKLPTEQGEDFLASPAISDGQIFLRSNRALYAVGARR